MRLSKNIIIQSIATIYIEFYRGTSLIIQMFWIYYVLPLFGVPLPALLAGVLALGMNFGAYGAEVFRAGILAVPKGQWEGALALNFSKSKKNAENNYTSNISNNTSSCSKFAVELLKGTALVSLITLVDLMFVAKQINMMTWLSAQSFGLALIIYFVMARFVLVPFLRWLELLAARKVGRGKI